jgi:hypothetical protein
MYYWSVLRLRLVYECFHLWDHNLSSNISSRTAEYVTLHMLQVVCSRHPLNQVLRQR